MPLARKILFYLFFAAYVFLCPLLILYSFGYIFNPQKREMSQTGLVRLVSLPGKADIFLGRSHYKYKTPATIEGLIPGEYRINLKLKGYKPWSHTVLITEGKAASFENILLVPDTFKPKSVSSRAFKDVILLPEAGILFLNKTLKLEDSLIIDPGQDTVRPLSSPGIPEANLPVANIFTQRKSKNALVYFASLWGKRYLLLKPQASGDAYVDLTQSITEKPISVEWPWKKDNELFLVYRDHVDLLNKENMEVYPNYFDKIKGFACFDKWLYVLNNENYLFRYSIDKTDSKVWFGEEPAIRQLFKGSHAFRLIVLEENVVFLLGENGELISTILPDIIFDSGVRGLEYYRQNRKIVIWMKDAIWVSGLESMFPECVYRQGSDIEQVFWAYNGTHLLFRDENRILLLEISPDGEHHVTPLATIKNNSDFFYSDDNGTLYYIEPKEDTPVAVKVLTE